MKSQTRLEEQAFDRFLAKQRAFIELLSALAIAIAGTITLIIVAVLHLIGAQMPLGQFVLGTGIIELGALVFICKSLKILMPEPPQPEA